MCITCQVRACLNAATHENRYPHEYERPSEDIVREIHDWSGIEGFDPNDANQMQMAKNGVRFWRDQNPQTQAQ